MIHSQNLVIPKIIIQQFEELLAASRMTPEELLIAMVRERWNALPKRVVESVTQPIPFLQPLSPQDEVVLNSFTYSSYQLSVFQHALQFDHNIIVNAVAGSGKTTTLVQVLKLVHARNKSYLMAAFNKKIQEEFNAKLKNNGLRECAKTAHAIGLASIKSYLTEVSATKPEISEDKFKTLAEAYILNTIRPMNQKDVFHAIRVLHEIINLARLMLVDTDDPEAIEMIIERQRINVVNYQDTQNMSFNQKREREKEESRLYLATIEAVPHIIKQGIRVAEQLGLIDFTDMVYLPNVWNLQPVMYDVVVVDECQDLSNAIRELLLKCSKGITIFVGDPKQSIYGFAGADMQSFEKIKEESHATELPLSICYRCPTSHVDLVKSMVPAIEAAPNAIEGFVEKISIYDVAALVREQKTDALIICRTTAPLIKLCLRLIGEGINAKVRGRDIGKQLGQMVDDISSAFGIDFNWARFSQHLSEYKRMQQDRLQRSNNAGAKLQTLEDNISALTVCYEKFTPEQCKTVDTFKNAINNLFGDDKNSVALSTVHQAKGLEAKYVYILNYETIRLKRDDQSPLDIEQEEHIEYVAKTRAMLGLYLVSISSTPKAEEEEEKPVFEAVLTEELIESTGGTQKPYGYDAPITLPITDSM